jgi:predicted ATPase
MLAVAQAALLALLVVQAMQDQDESTLIWIMLPDGVPDLSLHPDLLQELLVVCQTGG